jgi:hypothetical protein
LGILSWISDQLTILAEAFGESLTEERLHIYAHDLADISREQLQTAFLRARRELTWFPKIAELRNLAGVRVSEQQKTEAEAAWAYVNEFLRKWGVNPMPIYSGGKKITAPALDPRAEYALRRIGGLWALNQVDADRLPFMHRDFCESYLLAPVAEAMQPQLAGKFGDRILAGNVRQLADGMKMEGPPESKKS